MNTPIVSVLACVCLCVCTLLVYTFSLQLTEIVATMCCVSTRLFVRSLACLDGQSFAFASCDCRRVLMTSEKEVATPYNTLSGRLSLNMKKVLSTLTHTSQWTYTVRVAFRTIWLLIYTIFLLQCKKEKGQHSAHTHTFIPASINSYWQLIKRPNRLYLLRHFNHFSTINEHITPH